MRKNFLLAVIAVIVVLSGCSDNARVPEGDERYTVADPAEQPTDSIETQVPDEPLVYDPHIWSSWFDKYYNDERRELFHHLIDALCKGEDTFKCESREIYDWCTNDVTLGELFPVACMVVTGESGDGREAYHDGIGRICYKIPKKDFLTRERAFKKNVTDVINAVVKSSYSDFEKCLALYDYMESNYEYNYDWPDDTTDGFVYHSFMTHKGICGELASIYTYLLLVCGLDAVCEEDKKMDHAWSVVTIDGEIYHVDPTWSIKKEGEKKLFLDYFLMTNDDRKADGFSPKKWTLTILEDPFLTDYTVKISATDNKYSIFQDSYMVSIDMDENVLEYLVGNEICKYQYE